MAFITFITTCKNRLSHIKETMPLLYSEAVDEDIIFVDYGCSEGSGAWVQENFPKVKTIFVDDDPKFCLARARNIGASAANTDWLFFIDGDIKVKPGLLEWIKSNVAEGSFYRASPLPNGELDKETWGSCICMRNDYKKIEGYDEVFRGWGGEDDDFYARLSLAGFNQDFYHSSFVQAISHDDQIRLEIYSLKNKSHNIFVNQIYSSIKLALMRNMNNNKISNLIIKQPNYSVREKIMFNVHSKLEYWFKNPHTEAPIFNTAINMNLWLPGDYELVQQSIFNFKVVKKNQAKKKIV